MVKLGEIDNFNVIEKAAENTERKKQMKNVTLTENEKELISQWISDCDSLQSAKKLTGFSENYLSALKNKHRDTVRGSTYEIFQNILKPEPSPNAEEESEAVEECKMVTNEFEVMAKMDSLFSELSGSDTKNRVIDYFISKYYSSETETEETEEE